MEWHAASVTSHKIKYSHVELIPIESYTYCLHNHLAHRAARATATYKRSGPNQTPWQLTRFNPKTVGPRLKGPRAVLETHLPN